MGWQKLKQLLGIRITPVDADDASIQQLVSKNLPNRRQNFRVQYPKIGAGGPFPHVYMIDTEVLIANISAGGCLVIDDTDRLGSTVGEIIPLDFVWPTGSIRKRARIVGVTYDNRHLQFVDFNAQFFLQINKLVPPAMLGNSFHQVSNKSGYLAAAEMWTSQSNNTLVFHHDGLVELTFGGEKIRWGTANGRDTKMNLAQLSYIYVVLANMPSPSQRLNLLIEKLATQIAVLEYAQKKDGTDG